MVEKRNVFFSRTRIGGRPWTHYCKGASIGHWQPTQRHNKLLNSYIFTLKNNLSHGDGKFWTQVIYCFVTSQCWCKEGPTPRNRMYLNLSMLIHNRIISRFRKRPAVVEALLGRACPAAYRREESRTVVRPISLRNAKDLTVMTQVTAYSVSIFSVCF